MGFFDQFKDAALSLFGGGGPTLAPGAGAGATAGGIGVGQDAAAEALKAGGGLSFGSASVPGVAQGAGLEGKRLSEVLKPGMQIASQLLGLGGKLSGNPKAENIMGLMAAATGAAGASDDPQKALAAMKGPLEGITANLEEEEAKKQKRLSEISQPNQSLLDRQKAATAQAPPPRQPTAAGPPPATSLISDLDTRTSQNLASATVGGGRISGPLDAGPQGEARQLELERRLRGF